MYYHTALMGFIFGSIITMLCYGSRSWDWGHLFLAITIVCGGYIGFLMVAGFTPFP